MTAVSPPPKPNFFIVGAMKAGTTSMHRYLSQHPEIFMSVRKEPRYFAPDLDSGNEADGNWFTRRLDDYLANFAAAGGARIIGESSHVYLHSERAAGLIREFSPEARCLIMLRDPVEMVHARHQQSLWMAREDIVDVAEALAAEADRREGRRLPPDAPYTRGLQYREACTMTPQVKRYFDTFGRDRVKVVTLEDLAQDPRRVYRSVLEFLGVEPRFVPSDMGVANPSKGARNLRMRRSWIRLRSVARRITRALPAPVSRLLTTPAKVIGGLNKRRAPRGAMPAELEEKLTREFAADVIALSALLGRDLTDHWPRFRTISTEAPLDREPSPEPTPDRESPPAVRV